MLRRILPIVIITIASLAGVARATWSIGIDFRSTLGYVTDPAGCTYCLADAYPTTRGGATFGWVGTGASSRDRDNTVDPRLAGINFDNTSGDYFRLDLPAAGQYSIRVAIGDAAFSQFCQWELLDGTTSIWQATQNPAGGQFVDASQVTRTSAADWVTNNASISHTFTSTQMILKVWTTGSNSSVIAHVFVQQASTAVLFRRNMNMRTGSRSPILYHFPTPPSPREQFISMLRRIAA